MNHLYDLGFGDPVFARDALSSLYPGNFFNVLKSTYPALEGDVKLNRMIKKYIKTQTGWEPNYIILTNGATQGIFILVRSFVKMGIPNLKVSINQMSYMFYPNIIQEAGGDVHRNLMSRMFAGDIVSNEILLIDSPANPTGSVFIGKVGTAYNCIWDAAYHNKIYTDSLFAHPNANSMVGSFSKIFGLAGLRLGFIATDDPSLYVNCSAINNNMNCGINLHGQSVLMDIFENVDLDTYFTKARGFLDDNRGEMSRIENRINGNIPTNGMFMPFYYDNDLKNRLEEIGIKITTLESHYNGNISKTLRISLGQNREITKKAVDLIMSKL